MILPPLRFQKAFTYTHTPLRMTHVVEHMRVSYTVCGGGSGCNDLGLLAKLICYDFPTVLSLRYTSSPLSMTKTH